MDQKVDTFDRWHLMFDELCNRAGYFDDSALASAYCTLSKTKGQKQFETTVRNLNNWRSGRHLPRPANLRVLAQILKLKDNPALEARWNELYARDKELEASRGLALPDVPEAVSGEILPGKRAQTLTRASGHGLTIEASPYSAKRWSNLQAAIGGATLLCVGAAAGAAVASSGWRPWGGPADHAPIIAFKPNQLMKVGESRAIYAYRGDCGKLPPDWATIEATFPNPRLGTLTDGGLAQRNSKFCQGLTPAQAIVFNAKTAGVEEFEIQGDFFKMTVED